jgi:CxxC motif-containing protein (DUF1111 family)
MPDTKHVTNKSGFPLWHLFCSKSKRGRKLDPSLEVTTSPLESIKGETAMKLVHVISSGHVARSAGNGSRNEKRGFVLRSLILVLFMSTFAKGTVFGQAVDPGPRGGSVGAGQPIAGLNADQQRFFTNAVSQFNEVQNVTDPTPGNGGLGPVFNSNSCGSCHSQPATGGSSPSTSAFPFVGPNPQVAVATLEGASNKIPFFVTADGPVREARFIRLPNGQPDGGVHDLFTIAGRSDAPGCTLAQPNFEQAQEEHNLIFRIPTPVYGVGLIENLSQATLINNLNATAQARRRLGIEGMFNTSGNDGTITKLGWKAQNKSGLIFAGEAYNVEIGVTNEAFMNERSDPPASCLFNPTPEDTTIPGPVGSDPDQALSDIQDFEIVMRFLDQPTPGPSSPSTQNGFALFKSTGCATCHTPSMTTSASFVSGLSNVQANLFSDLAIHHMGENLEDGITQDNAGPDQFRTAPLWGIGQRVYFLHDGRTSDLLQAVQAHASRGSEANAVIRNFSSLTVTQQQDLLNFLRSL